MLFRSDKPAYYFLAVVKNNRVLIAGWIPLADGLRVGELREHDTYWVPQDRLWSMDTWVENQQILLSDEVVVRQVN